MSEVDDLKARFFDLVDERACLQADFVYAINEKAAEKTMNALEEVHCELSTVLDDLVALGREIKR